MIEEKVILVDENDVAVGVAEKIEAHRKNLLHRAFSIFVFNSQGLFLLQKRAANKYHSGELWSNTCCGHPRPGETTLAAAHRRLQEEMGFDCPLEERFAFIYQAQLVNGLFEHELDHVFVGLFNGDPLPDPAEVAGWRWVALGDLEGDMAANPENYTLWLRLCLKERKRLLGEGA